MGGPISIAARFNDGQTICVDGWTNFTPNMIINADTFTGSDATVRKTLLEVAAHPNYSGPQPFRASGYGMIVIDFMARQIHSLQGYTSFGRKMLIELLDINATGWQGDTYVNVLKPASEWLLDNGRVRLIHMNGDFSEEGTLTRERAIRLLDEESSSYFTTAPRRNHMVMIDVSPFEVFDYGESGPLTPMRRRLEEVGFPMTKAKGLNAMFAGGRSPTMKDPTP